MAKYIAGIDEAGRGPVIGPMVMAIVACYDSEMDRLKKAGVKDSKMLLPSQREALFSLSSSFPHKIICISPKQIDDAVLGKSQGDNLNILEARTTAQLIYDLAKQVEIEKVIIDSPTRTTSKHESDIRLHLQKIDGEGITKKIALQCEIKADANHVIVGAASILAKVTRDKEIESIAKLHGAIGSGYPSDPQTQEFLSKNWKEGYDFFRKSWESYAKLAKQGSQMQLGSFDDGQSQKGDDAKKMFEPLTKYGFSFALPTNKYELVRMRNDSGTTVIYYSTAKTIVQGNDKEGVESLLIRLGLLSDAAKRPRGRPKKK